MSSLTTVTLLFTDIEGSTRLWDSSPTAMAACLARHDQILSEHIGAGGGRIVKHTGDGAFAVFETVPAAVRAVLACQKALANEPWPHPIGSLKVRMGIHVGSVAEKGGDYFGPDLSRAARLESAAHGGQVLLSEAARSLAIDSLDEGLDLVELGEYRFKGLTRPERVFQLVGPGMQAAFPPLRTERMGTGAGLPTTSSSFIGREDLVERIGSLVADGHPLITLTGPGGVGKSRLALAVAASIADRFEHGAHFVPLATATTPEEVVQGLVEALDFQVDTHSSDLPPIEQLLAYLSRRRVLLILDNFEQLVEVAAGIPAQLVAGSPGSLALVTSRERLRHSEEWTVEVPGLDSRDRHSPAVALFADRCLRAGRSIDGHEIGAATRICNLVGGMPLGIELAASWSGLLGLEEIEAELGRSLSSIDADARDVPERHRTLAAACETSWALLDEEERRVFAALGVFQGPFGRSAAEAVAETNLRTLAALASKSLLHGQGIMFDLHPVLRRYARERLESGDGRPVAARHAAHYLDWLESLVPDLEGFGQIDARDEVRHQLPDVLAAIRWIVRKGADADVLRGLRALTSFMRIQGWHEGKVELSRLRAMGLDRFGAGTPMDAAISVYQAAFAVELDDPDEAIRLAAESLPRLEDEQFEIERAVGLTTVGIGASLAGRYEESAEVLERAVQASVVDGLRVGRGAALLWLGWDWLELGHSDKALSLFEESLELFRSSGNTWGSAYALSKLGLVADALGDHQRAMDYQHEGREVFVKLGDRAGEAYTLSRLSWTEWLLGDFEQAERSASDAIELFEGIGHLWGGIAGHGRRGFARVGLGDLAGAEDDFRVVLERSIPAEIKTMVQYGVTGFGCVLEASGTDDGRAVEILVSALGADGLPRQYRADYIEPALGKLADRVPAADFEAARERGSGMKVSEVADSLISRHSDGIDG